MAEQCSQLSNLHANASVLLVKHQSRKVSLLRCCLLCFILCLVEFAVKNYRLSRFVGHSDDQVAMTSNRVDELQCKTKCVT